MKRLTTIVELMGGKLAYDIWNGEHIYTISFKKYTFIAKSQKDNVAQKNVETNLNEVFPIQYKNAVNQLK